VQKYVVSSTLTEPGWQHTTVLDGDPVEQVRALEQQPGTDIVVTGSITLCHTLIAAGLVDEYRLFTYPAVQGRGRRLFPRRRCCRPAPAGRVPGVPQRRDVLALRPRVTPAAAPRGRRRVPGSAVQQLPEAGAALVDGGPRGR
jgi:hypothetical protein